MREPGKLPKGVQKILIVLAIFGYLTAGQIIRLCYSAGSRTYVRALLKSLVDCGFALVLGGRAVQLPLIYTLSRTGRQYASFLGAAKPQRFRQSEAQEKARNPFFSSTPSR
jgi:hypothetical protein